MSGISVQGAASCVALLVVLLASPLQRWRVQEAEVERIRSQYELASWVSQARLPRTEPSTELITAHKVNHRAAHVAGRALGIFAKVRSHRVVMHVNDHTSQGLISIHHGVIFRWGWVHDLIKIILISYCMIDNDNKLIVTCFELKS